jgi:hypothetical protein
MIRKHLVAASVAAVLAATDCASAQSSGFSLAAGIDYSTGKYGARTATDIVYVPFTGRYETDNWVFKLTVPYLVITGPGNVVRDVGIVKNKAAGPRRTESGLGDIVGAVSRNILDIASTGTLVDITGKIKFGTADAGQGLGTGEDDYAAQVDVTQRVGPMLSVFGSLGYKIVGSPSGAQLNDVAYGEAGAAIKITDSLRVGGILDASQAVSTVSGEQRELTAYVTQQLSERWKLQVYAVKGFANGSPDYGAGATATLAF